MRVLLLDGNVAEARSLQHELAGRYDVRHAADLSAALAALRHATWRPDVVVASLDGEVGGLGVVRELQAAAAGIPVLLRAGESSDRLREQLDSVASLHESDASAGFSLLRAMLQQQHLVNQTIAAHRGELMREIERTARQAADAAAARAVDELIDRLGLDDEEGMRLAIRLARGWESAKVRFLSAVAAGLGSAFLLALGAGLVTVLRSHTSR